MPCGEREGGKEGVCSSLVEFPTCAGPQPARGTAVEGDQDCVLLHIPPDSPPSLPPSPPANVLGSAPLHPLGEPRKIFHMPQCQKSPIL